MSESSDRRMKTPWTALQDWINTIGGAVAIIGAISAAAAFTLGVMPFVRKDIYENDMTQVRLEVGGLKDMTKQNTAAVAAVNRNTLLNLELNLQSRIELLNGVMAGVPRGSQTYMGLMSERDTAKQQLDEVKRELSR